jgi:hypothetical protein
MFGMNTRSVREYTLFASAQLLRGSGLASSVILTCHIAQGGTASDFIFVLLYVSAVGLRFKWHMPYNKTVSVM